MRVLTIIGARPQFIKAAAFSRALAEHRSDIEEIIVHTGQHYDANMSAVFFDELDIPMPNENLGIGGGSHGQNTGRMLEALEALAIKIKPDWVVVYGDTDSTLAGALAASKLHIPVAHAEAGLRSFNRQMPEEINRVLTDHISDLLWIPTDAAAENLKREGIDAAKVHQTGDLMYDAALYYQDRARQPAELEKLGVTAGEFLLCTVHRAENTDSVENLAGILKGLAAAPFPVVLPLHPRTRGRIADAGLEWPKNVHVIDPVGYLEMVWLERSCAFVLTDSGGVQKEAFFHGKPCITLREETEWVELVKHGWNSLAGNDPQEISKCIAQITTPSDQLSLYGRGDAGRRMAETLK